MSIEPIWYWLVASTLRKSFVHFRAEMGRSRRHLSEFSMIEAEVAFVDNIASVTDVVEGVVRKSVEDVLSSNSADIETYLNFRTTRKVRYFINKNLFILLPAR